MVYVEDLGEHRTPRGKDVTQVVDESGTRLVDNRTSSERMAKQDLSKDHPLIHHTNEKEVNINGSRSSKDGIIPDNRNN